MRVLYKYNFVEHFVTVQFCLTFIKAFSYMTYCNKFYLRYIETKTTVNVILRALLTDLKHLGANV